MNAMTVIDALTAPVVTPDVLKIRLSYWKRTAERYDRAGRVSQARRIRSNCRAMSRLSKAEAPSVRVIAAVPKLRPASSGKVKAEAFWALHAQAVEAIIARYGTRWGIRAPVGETVLYSLPPSLRSYKTKLGIKIAFRRDWSAPAAMYWPGGKIPEGVIFAPPVVQATGPSAMELRRDAMAREWQARMAGAELEEAA